jgi:ankyrin repeat protein
LTPLVLALRSGVATVNWFAEGNALQSRDTLGNGALHLAVLHGDAATVSRVLELGAPTGENLDGLTPLDLARQRGFSEAVGVLESSVD